MTTPRLGLDELAQNQSQPHVAVNAALRRIDVLVQSTAIEFITVLPGSYADGDVYIAASAGVTGPLVGKEDYVVYYYGGWNYIAPFRGMKFFMLDSEDDYRYDDTGSPVGWLPV